MKMYNTHEVIALVNQAKHEIYKENMIAKQLFDEAHRSFVKEINDYDLHTMEIMRTKADAYWDAWCILENLVQSLYDADRGE